MKTDGPKCQWAGCTEKASHRAPKGRGAEKDYWSFCLAHVRHYNQNYNFFKGMSDAAVMAYQKDALTGHRPTWKMGTGKGAARPDFSVFGNRNDPFEIYSARACAPSSRRKPRPGRSAMPSARRSTGSASMSAPPRRR